jgi:3'(2'), 5'-bisphosphate nucleotidase
MIPPSLELLVPIAVAAGDRIMAIYGSDFSIARKADNSPVTSADMAAHEHIVAELTRLWPEIPVLSEEAANIDFEQRRKWTRYWLVDPLDGTKEFIKRNGEFTVNIALVENGEPTMAVVHAPALGVTYSAAAGQGAFRAALGERKAIRTRTVPELPERPTLVVSKSHRDAATDKFLEDLPAHEAISRGSSLKLCLVAEGSADLYPRIGPTSEWDTAAGHCIAAQAGAAVLRLPELTPLKYNEKDSLLNPFFVIIGDPAYPWLNLFPKPPGHV